MLLIKKRSAVAVFYALISVDGEIGADELEKLDELGQEIDPENFTNYRDEVIADGQTQSNKMIDEDDLYDVIAESTQDALHDTTEDPAEGVYSRLLLWDLLALAYANADYDASQRRLIKHVCRVIGCEASVFLEMEQLMQTYISVEKERSWLKQSNRPYTEIEPLVAELDSRIKILTSAAGALISDEMTEPTVTALTYGPGKVEVAMGALGEKMEPVISEISDKTNQVFESAKSQFGTAATAMSAEFGKQKDRLFSGLKKKMKNAAWTAADNQEEE